MIIPVNKSIEKFANNLPKPLYIVGGYVRNYIISKETPLDVDLTAPIPATEFCNYVKANGWQIISQNMQTASVVFTDGETTYEYTAFRTEKYTGGGFHTPTETNFTEDINKDCLRRDFTCNALYYDIANKKLLDPCGRGLEDTKNKVLSTVRDANVTFSEDGLRLLRLARFCGELDFTIAPLTLEGATLNSKSASALTGGRVYSELNKILVADRAYPFSNPKGHYVALKVLDKTRVLDQILPEITLGRNMPQCFSFHKHDVLEHMLRCVLYADASVRLSALLHDVGKPACKIKNGNFAGHEIEGSNLAQTILTRFGVDKKTIKEVCRLIRWHMLGIGCNQDESQIRQFIVSNVDIFEKLLFLKQADYTSGCERTDLSPNVKRWQTVYDKMVKDGVPFSIKQLKISSKDLQDFGFKGAKLGQVRKQLFNHVINCPEDNNKTALTILSAKFID